MEAVTSEITATLPSFFAAARVLSHSAATLAELKPQSAITMRTSIITTIRNFITSTSYSMDDSTASLYKGLRGTVSIRVL